MMHPHTMLKYINPEKGFGVVATSFIPKGTITWVLDSLDMVLEQDYIDKLDISFKEPLDTYCFKDAHGKSVLCWDHGRYINHSFRSNCMTTAYDFEIAIKDIEIGEELTDDYGYLNLDKPFRPLDENTKRKVVYPDDLNKYYKSWDKKIASIFPLIMELEQPLLALLPKSVSQDLEEIKTNKKPIKSILNCSLNKN